MITCSCRASVSRLAILLLLIPAAMLDIRPAAGQTAAEKQAAQQIYVQALALERQGQLTQAADKILEAIQFVPENETFLSYAAALELRAKRPAQALDHAVTLSRLKPKNTSYLVLVMKAAIENLDAPKAEEAARSVIALGASRVGQATMAEARKTLADSLFLQALA